MNTLKVDVAILGAGTAGLAAYRAAKEYSNSVVLIDGGPLGTTCARVGCMPSKLLIAAAEAAHSSQHTAQFGVHNTETHIDDKKVMARVRSERDRFVGFVNESIESFPQADLIRANARFENDNTLMLSNGSSVQAQKIIIATGSRPSHPPVLNGAGSRLVVNDDIFEWRELPKKVAIFGPGVIGLELGQALHRLGVDIRLFGVGGSIGPLRDPIVKHYAKTVFEQEFYLDTSLELKTIQEVSDGVEIEYQHLTEGWITETFDYVVAATGRRPNVDNLSISNTSLALDERGMLLFDPWTMQCGKSSIFIAGDANNDRPLLHEAADEGKIAGVNAALYPAGVRAGKRRAAIGVVFSDPQIATVGLSLTEVEQRCVEQFAIGEVSFENQGRSRVMGLNKGLLRLYGEQGTGLFLGAEMIGPRAEHIAHLLSWAVQQRMTVSQMLDMPFYHPVIEEGVRTALRDLNAKLHIGPQVVENCLDCGAGG